MKLYEQKYQKPSLWKRCTKLLVGVGLVGILASTNISCYRTPKPLKPVYVGDRGYLGDINHDAMKLDKWGRPIPIIKTGKPVGYLAIGTTDPLALSD